MANEKTFTVCGTARNVDGTLKVRVANDIVSRIKTLVKYDCTDINLIELPEDALPDETHERVVIRGVSSGIRPPISPGNQAVVLSHMIEEVEFEGEKLNLILENHILGIFEKET